MDFKENVPNTQAELAFQYQEIENLLKNFSDEPEKEIVVDKKISLEIGECRSDISSGYCSSLQALNLYLLNELEKLLIEVSPNLTSITQSVSPGTNNFNINAENTDLENSLEDTFEAIRKSNLVHDFDKTLIEKHTDLIVCINRLLGNQKNILLQDFNNLTTFLVETISQNKI
jgi:hypothetical protein